MIIDVKIVVIMYSFHAIFWRNKFEFLYSIMLKSKSSSNILALKCMPIFDLVLIYFGDEHDILLKKNLSLSVKRLDWWLMRKLCIVVVNYFKTHSTVHYFLLVNLSGWLSKSVFMCWVRLWILVVVCSSFVLTYLVVNWPSIYFCRPIR